MRRQIVEGIYELAETKFGILPDALRDGWANR